MVNTNERFQEVFNELYTLSIADKILFLQILLSDFTIAGRAIWSDDGPTENEKVEAFKWLNELCHRIWTIIFKLQGNEDNDSIARLYENMKFYGQQSCLLCKYLMPTIFGSFDNFKARQ